MKIGIVGTGNMGRAIGVVLAEVGHEVFFGAREPEKAAAAVALAPGTKAGTLAEAAGFGEVLVYTARGVAPQEAIGPEAAALMAGKIVIDMNNQEVPPDFGYPAIEKSLAETLAEQIPEAKVVKAFNTIPMETFEWCPRAIAPFQVSAFVAGDDEAARETVCGLARGMGFDAIDCGPLRQARLLEGAADLIRLLLGGQKLKGVNFSLAVVPTVVGSKLGGRQESGTK